jgi:trans-aconitate methyltransferase
VTAKVRHDPLLAVDQTVQRLEAALFVPHGDDSGFDLHSLPLAEFLAGMAVAGEPGTFIDLGCGIGTKLAIAHWLGWDVTGVERHSDYAAVARKVVPEAKVYVGDAWTFEGLAAFDIVYSYRLMVDLARQDELNSSIVAQMRPGTLFFCAGSDPHGLIEVGAGVWRV